MGEELPVTIDLPEGSLYLWMYRQGLRRADIGAIEDAVHEAGRMLRQKDVDNYWNGWYKSTMSEGRWDRDILSLGPTARQRYPELSDFPEHPYPDAPNPPCRWVPVGPNGTPLIKWSRGCMMRSEASAWRGACGIAENLVGCKFIAIDFDGDHGDELDMDCIAMASMLSGFSCAWSKPDFVDGMSKSVHVLFRTDRVMPTMHFPEAHIDIIGNEKNSIRYLKNKTCNNIRMSEMTPDLWKFLMEYIRGKESM